LKSINLPASILGERVFYFTPMMEEKPVKESVAPNLCLEKFINQNQITD